MHLPPPPQPPHPPPPPTLPRHPLRRPHPPLPLSHQVREAPLLHRHQNYNSSFYQMSEMLIGGGINKQLDLMNSRFNRDFIATYFQTFSYGSFGPLGKKSHKKSQI